MLLARISCKMEQTVALDGSAAARNGPYERVTKRPYSCRRISRLEPSLGGKRLRGNVCGISPRRACRPTEDVFGQAALKLSTDIVEYA